MSEKIANAVPVVLIEELERLRDDIRQLSEPLSEAEFWARPLEPGNSVGHLILHLAGNLNHFVGAHLGNTAYIRDREREFTETHVPAKEETLARLDDAVALYRRVVGGLSEDRLLSPHPEVKFGSVLQALVRLLAHFALHRGQISYLVRLVKPEAG